jgi:glycosyltransferase involved in cell wall biosynthesis
MNDKPFTVATITSGRDDHLRNLIRGIERSSVLPGELVIAYMNQPDELSVDSTVPIRSLHVTSDILPLARSRNECVRNASNEIILFLDVDCIPSSTMFERLLRLTPTKDSLVMATPFYLYKDTDLNEFDDAYLMDNSTVHQSRAKMQGGYSNDYAAFWSLCFALTKQTFENIGGFDEGYVGYGGEDTDFAFSAQKAGVKFYLDKADCYHQYHKVYKPPVQHVGDIVLNSNYFFKKWHKWPMKGWLKEFVDMGYIRWTEDAGTPIEIVRLPSEAEQKLYEDSRNPY